MTISVVISTYNGENYILEQLQSIVHQTVLPDEVVIIDDCSTDNTVSLIKEFICKNIKINWKLTVNERNKGWKKNFMSAISKATGDIIFTCDQDDIWYNDKIEIMSDIMREYKEINLLVSDYQSDNSKDTYDINGRLQVSVEKINMNDKFMYIFFPGCVYCFRKVFFDNIKQYWFEEYPHDALLWRYAMISESLYYMPVKTIYWRRHEDAATVYKIKTRQEKINSIEYYQHALKDLCSLNLEQKQLKRCLKFSKYLQNRLRLLKPGKTGTEVKVKVSMGIRQVEIQDLENLSLSVAENKLIKDGFKVKKTFIESDEVEKDNVIRTEPAAHEMADQGSTVVLFVSLGPENTEVYVPNFVKLPLNVALERANEYFLDAEVEYEDNEEFEKDAVIKQSIEPGSTVDRDTKIILTVSSGEISEKTKKLTFSLPKKATGEFEFRYFVDGVLDPDSSITLDIGLASSKTLKYEVSGKPGETKLVTVKVTSLATGLSGTYMDITVTFPEDGGKPTAEDTVNSKIFDELNAGVEPEPTEEPVEPDEPQETIETNEPDPAQTEPAHTDPAQTEPAEPFVPDPGISVD